VTYVVAILALAAVCILSWLVQRWAGSEIRVGCVEGEEDCSSCARREGEGEGGPLSVPGPAGPPSPTTHAARRSDPPPG
jgi:hypothetical protein